MLLRSFLFLANLNLNIVDFDPEASGPQPMVVTPMNDPNTL